MCIKLVAWKSLYYDARSEKHQIDERYQLDATIMIYYQK